MALSRYSRSFSSTASVITVYKQVHASHKRPENPAARPEAGAMTNLEGKRDDQGKSGERTAKVIARAGLASRREAEAWIAAGRVAINGATITSPAINVGLADRVRV